jgi:hypothetical protein
MSDVIDRLEPIDEQSCMLTDADVRRLADALYGDGDPFGATPAHVIKQKLEIVVGFARECNAALRAGVFPSSSPQAGAAADGAKHPDSVRLEWLRTAVGDFLDCHDSGGFEAEGQALDALRAAHAKHIPAEATHA